MKKIIHRSLTIVASTFLFIACKENRNFIKVSDIPSTGQSIVNEHFSDLRVAHTEKETDGSYEIEFTNGIKIDFDANGNWKNVDAADGQPLTRTGFIPESIVLFLEQKYPQNAINGIERKTNGYEVELLKTTREIVFDLEGNYVTTKD